MANEPLNEWQKLAALSYGDGDYAYIAREPATPDEVWAKINEVGDTLFLFVMKELSSAEGVDCVETAVNRLETAINDLRTVIDRLETGGEYVSIEENKQ